MKDIAQCKFNVFSVTEFGSVAIKKRDMYVSSGLVWPARPISPLLFTVQEFIALCTSFDSCIHSFEFGIRPIRNKSDYITIIAMIILFSLIGQSEI